MHIRGQRFFCFAAVLLIAASSARATPQPQAQPSPGNGAPPARVWMGMDGQPLPFTSDEEVLQFLRSAKVKSMTGISVGITGPKKVLLERNGVLAHAHFNRVEEEKPYVVMADGRPEILFRDTYKFQGAAYELSRLLGLDNVPPAVERRAGGDIGSLALWIENAMTEQERRKKEIKPPDTRRWTQQLQIMHVFDNLIYNTDRNTGNLLIDSNWKIWLIDHTRAFRRQPELNAAQTIRQCERGLWQKLKDLDERQVRERLKAYLRGYEMDALLQRRVKLVAYIEELIRTRGEAEVLFSSE